MAECDAFDWQPDSGRFRPRLKRHVCRQSALETGGGIEGNDAVSRLCPSKGQWRRLPS